MTLNSPFGCSGGDDTINLMKNTPLEETYIQTNGIRLHVMQAGPVDGPLVVLLHGFPEFWRGWIHQIEPLAEAGYRVVVPDQRGYNLSDVPKPVKAYRLEELQKDILGLLDALGRQDCCLAGHDWGAVVAWSLALNYPEKVKKLAILNVPHPLVMQRYLKTNLRQMLKSWYIGFFQIPGLADWLVSRKDFRQGAAALRGSSRPGTFSAKDLSQYKQAWRNSGGIQRHDPLVPGPGALSPGRASCCRVCRCRCASCGVNGMPSSAT